MLVLFEDERWHYFVPLVYTRPIYELRCGAFTLRERVAALLRSHPELLPYLVAESERYQNGHNQTLPVAIGDPLSPRAVSPPDYQTPHGICRTHLMTCYGAINGVNALLRTGGPLTLINGRALQIDWLPALLRAPAGTVYVAQGQLLAARLSPALASVALYYLREQQATDALAELHRFARVVEIESDLLNYPWDLVSQTGEQLVRDLPLLAARLAHYTSIDPNIVVRGTHVYVSPQAELDGPLVLDARDGPIYIDQQALIEPFSLIQGPAYIGPKTQISSARIRGESSFGPVCRIGGEVEASIIQGYSNKHHDGFLGHSWLGEWVNIGAMTTNSDLKNTYSNVRVLLHQIGQIDTGTIKLGCFLADHVKLGIGLHLTGGAIVGTASNIYGVHMVPKTVPPFTWGSDTFYEYQFERMIDVTRRVMSRRKRELSAEYETMLQTVFAMTRSHRESGQVATLSLVSQPRETLETLSQAERAAIRAYEPAAAVPVGQETR